MSLRIAPRPLSQTGHFLPAFHRHGPRLRGSVPDRKRSSIDTLAAEMKLGVIDMHAALADQPRLLPDRVHPNAEGAGEMARAAFTALTGKPAATAK